MNKSPVSTVEYDVGYSLRFLDMLRDIAETFVPFLLLTVLVLLLINYLANKGNRSPDES